MTPQSPNHLITQSPLRRILVVLPNWYGETLFATPFLRALRGAYPAAHLATLGWPQCGDIVLHNPHLNEHLIYDERGCDRGLFGLWRLVRRLRAQQFDTAFILRRSLTRTLLLAAAGIPHRIGFDDPKSRWALTRRVPPGLGGRHKAATYLPLLRALGIAAAMGSYEYFISAEERREALQRLQQQRLLGPSPLVVLHPGANWEHKRWPAERFAALADRLIASHHAKVAVTGGPNDISLAQAVTQHMRLAATVLAGQTSLRQLGACLEHAALVVSNDTGITHLAAALRRPLVALYGPTDPAFTGPLGDPNRTVVLHHAGCCPQIPCFSPDQPPHAGMYTITVDEVYKAAADLLSNYGR